MASFKCKGYYKKKQASKLGMVDSGLRKENALLKKTMADMTCQQSEHNKLVGGFLSAEAAWLETFKQLVTKDEKCPLPPEQDSVSDEVASTNSVIKLQNLLADALEKNKQWLEYDQQREAYVRAVLARMLWLEKQLDEANQARSQQHNEDHSDENVYISETKEHYEMLLKDTNGELELLREQVDIIHHELIETRNRCKERESEAEELKRQLRAEKRRKESAPEDDHSTEDEEPQVKDEISDLQNRQEKRRSANLEFLLKCHHEAQEKIADLERQVKISSQDLEDERQDSSYLKRQFTRVLKLLKKTRDRLRDQRDEQDQISCEVAHPHSVPSGDVLTSSPHTSLLNGSFLECPSCQAEYPASHYRELMNHVEICLD